MAKRRTEVIDVPGLLQRLHASLDEINALDPKAPSVNVDRGSLVAMLEASIACIESLSKPVSSGS